MLIKLLDFVEKYLDDGMSLFDAFLCFAKQNAYTAKSVKRCFIAALQGFKDRPTLAKKMGVNLKKLSDPANAFNMTAVNKYLCQNGLSLDKGLFALCLGDSTEITALRNRFLYFFPTFNQQEETNLTPAVNKPCDTTLSFALALQTKYCNG